MILSKNSDLFDFSSCNFAVQKSKSDTARVAVYELGISNSFTLEASFQGPSIGPRKDTQYSIHDLEQLGQSWCQSLLIYFKLKKFVSLKAREVPTSSPDSVVLAPQRFNEEVDEDDDELEELSDALRFLDTTTAVVPDRPVNLLPTGSTQDSRVICSNSDDTIESPVDIEDIFHECEIAVSTSCS